MRSAGGPSAQTQYAADGEVVGGVEALRDPPGGVVGGQVEGARGDVDVGDLHRHRLELRQRAAELRRAP